MSLGCLFASVCGWFCCVCRPWFWPVFVSFVCQLPDADVAHSDEDDDDHVFGRLGPPYPQNDSNIARMPECHHHREDDIPRCPSPWSHQNTFHISCDKSQFNSFFSQLSHSFLTILSDHLIITILLIVYAMPNNPIILELSSSNTLILLISHYFFPCI